MKKRRKFEEKELEEKLAQQRRVITFEDLIERAVRIFDAAWDSYEASRNVVQRQTVIKNGERCNIYICKPNAKLAGDGRFLDICIKANAQLYVFYSSNYSSVAANVKQTDDLLSRAEKVLENLINEQKMIKVSAEMVKSDEVHKSNGDANESVVQLQLQLQLNDDEV